MKKLNVFILISLLLACNSDDNANNLDGYKTENVIIVVIDGVRYSEAWGEPTKQYIPRQANIMLQEGVFYSSFRNEGPTFTTAGHTAITTGVYQQIEDNGEELPDNPSFMQYWSEKYNTESSKSWVITSNDKLEVLSNCKELEWKDMYVPSTDCGENGLGTGDRFDAVTNQRVLELLSTHHPNLTIINFRRPDFAANFGSWNSYINGVSMTDEFVYQLWSFIKTDPFYKDKTALFITNDHGRHLDDVLDGFVSHGDSCEGCKHISLFAYGPDFKQNHIENTTREQIDISVTVGELLNFEVPTSQGEVMSELFKN